MHVIFTGFVRGGEEKDMIMDTLVPTRTGTGDSSWLQKGSVAISLWCVSSYLSYELYRQKIRFQKVVRTDLVIVSRR